MVRTSSRFENNQKQSIALIESQKQPLSTYNILERLEEVSEDANKSIEPVRETKPPPIFISKLNDPSSLRQLLNQIANDEFDLKNINTGNFKIQIKSSIAYINIVKQNQKH